MWVCMYVCIFGSLIHKTAISTPFGLFEYVRMGFGLRNASQTFQRFINQVTRGLDFVFAYVDDILIASDNSTQHREHLRILFKRLSDFGVNVNRLKCAFGVQDLTFLGHKISAMGISPTEEKVAAIMEFPAPTSRKQVSRFIGMVNYYHRFVPNISELLIPLYKMDCLGHPQHLNRNKGEMERADRAAERESSWRDWSDDYVDG